MTTDRRPVCPDHGNGFQNYCRVCSAILNAYPRTGKDVFHGPDTADEYPHIAGSSRAPLLAVAAEDRKNAPIARGVLDYFPRALAAVATLSKIGNDQHNPGEEMHWARGKSNDHADCLVRHLIERGTVDTDGVLHSTKVAWRALANLELELEAASAASGS